MGTSQREPLTQLPVAGIGWINEELEHSIRSMAGVLDDLHRDNTPSELLIYQVQASLTGAVRVLSFLNGPGHEAEDAALVVDEGANGFEQLLVRFKDDSLYCENRKYYHVAPLTAAIRELLAGDRAPNRTFMNELLLNVKLQAPWIERLRQLTEDVTMGRIDWQEYVSAVKEILPEDPPPDPHV